MNFSFADDAGFTGVTLLLLAFVLNLFNRIRKESLTYLLLNVLGAGIACMASCLIRYIPFIILEAAWTLVSLGGLYRYFRTKVSH